MTISPTDSIRARTQNDEPASDFFDYEHEHEHEYEYEGLKSQVLALMLL